MTCKKLVRGERGTEQNCLVLRERLAILTSTIHELMFHPFFKRNFPIALLSAAWCLQLVFDNCQLKAEILVEISVPMVLEAKVNFMQWLL